MTGEESRIRIIVKSKKVPVRLFESNYGQSFALRSYSGETKRHVIFETVLDKEQEKLVSEARSLAEMLKVQVEVIDIGNENVAKRLYRALLRRTLKAPSIVFPAEIWSGFDNSTVLFQMISKKQPLESYKVIELISSHLRGKYENTRYRDEKEPIENIELVLTK